MPNDFGCTVSVPGIPITFTIERRQYVVSSDLSSAMAVRTQFDADTLLPSPSAWRPDPGWTSPPVPPRWDSFAARRVSWLKIPVGPPPAGPQTSEGVFSTTAIKRGVFLGVSAHLQPGYLFEPLAVWFQSCLQNPVFPGCPDLIQRMKNLGTSAVAVHLAMFPIG